MFVHGVGEDSRVWQPQLDALADEFTVVAWDEPGAGRSSVSNLERPNEFNDAVREFAVCTYWVRSSQKLAAPPGAPRRSG
jgi:pimeloyl-ACP methyl ester carboxylesterase